jgi:hypothetical protein
MPFTLTYDPTQNVLLVTFGATLTRETHLAMVAAVRAFVARHGPAHAIADFGAVRDFRLDVEYVRNLAHTQAVLAGQKRVMVAPTDEIFGMMRLFAVHQSSTGDAAFVVRTRAEAFDHLGLVAPDFQPV